jgi:CheY-like chemotaxis protein
MRTVLVVDDEFGVPELLEFVLQEEGYRVVSATNGRQGLQRLAEDPRPGLVLLDYMMPVLNGPGMLNAMREGDFKSVPVVFMSSLDEDAVRKAAEHEFQAFLRKPFKLAELVDIVRRLLPQD